MPMDSPDLFETLDYRAWLRARYAELKASNPAFSYRYFARKAGLGSPSYLKLVMDGERNLRTDTAHRFAKALGLDAQETRYFVALVAYNQAATTADRTRHYEALCRIPRFRRARGLEKQQHDYYSRWYCVVIRELVARRDFQEDSRWIAAQLRPRVSPAKVEEALRILLDLGLLARDGDGRLVQSDALVTTGRSVDALAVRRFHHDMMALGSAALDDVPKYEREVGGVTFRLSPAQLRRLKDRLYDLRQELLQLDGADDDNPHAVYHFGFQLVPLTHLEETS